MNSKDDLTSNDAASGQPSGRKQVFPPGQTTQRQTSGSNAASRGKSPSPADARKAIESRPLPPNIYRPESTTGISPRVQSGVASDTTQGPASISELARALNNNVDLIYEFVYNNIEFHATYGLQKGAWAALVDGFGNAFDQCDLMVQLLTTAGYTAKYVSGTAQLTVAQLMAWLGTADWDSSENVLVSGGIPAVEYTDGTTDWVQFGHMWVQVNIGGTNYYFDPTIKSYTTKSSINLASAMGYTQSTFLSDAKSGATITTDYVQNLNTTNIHNDLKTYAMNLASWIRTNNFGAGLDDILGGRNIVPTTGIVRNTSIPNDMPGDTPVFWTSIPGTYKATMQVQYDTINITFFSSDICGRRLTCFYNASNEMALTLEGTVVATSSARTPGNFEIITLTIIHPYWYTNEYISTLGIIVADGNYNTLCNYWGMAGRGMLDYRKQQLSQQLFNGVSATDESTLGEALNITYINRFLVWQKARDLFDRISGCRSENDHEAGLIGLPSTQFAGMNLGTAAYNTPSLSGGNSNNQLLEQAFAGFCMEAGSFQQMLGTVAVSADTAIDAANTQGMKVYLATSSNWSGTVEPNLTNYDSDTLNNISNSISNGDYILLPAQGLISIPSTSLTATGYVDIVYQPNQVDASGVILGFAGGINGTPTDPGHVNDGNKNNGPDPPTIGSPTPPVSWEPISLFSGDYLYTRDDISVGSGPSPYSLTFTRYYNSRDRLSNTGLGLGWSHSFEMSALANSDGFKGLGSDNAIDAAAAIAGLYVVNDLIAGTSSPVVDLYTIAILILRWWVDQISINTVVVSLPSGAVVFTKLPDGSYSTPSNSSSTLTQNVDGTYKLTTPQQIVVNFNSSGDVSTIVYPFGVTWTFTYSSSMLQSLTNGLGRTLTLNYTSGKLTSVSDGNGRSVSFLQDGSGNLTTFTDTLSHSITYVYDQPGRLTQFFLPANPTTAMVTNVYDSLNRVKTQSDANNNVWTYFFAGARSQETDPNNNSRVFYFTGKGGVTRYIDQLGNEADSVFDGRGRYTQITMAEGNQFQYSYDTNSNVLSVTRVGKPGSGLSNTINSLTYDSTWNKVKTATDGNNNTTTFSYDPSTGNLLTVVRPQVNGQTPQASFTWNNRGQIQTITDETSIVTQLNYDTSTEKLTSIVADYGSSPHLNLTSLLGYDSVGNATSVQDPNGNSYSYQFDSERRLTQRTAPAPFSFITNLEYDSNSNVTSMQRQTVGTPAWQVFNYSYYATNKLHTVTDPLSYVTTFDYDTMNRLWHLIDAQNRKVTISYDARSSIQTITDPSNTVADSRTYTNNGLLYQRTDARNKTTTYSYDGFDRQNKITFADSTYVQASAYDANDNILSSVMRSGASITNTFDVLNRRSTKSPTGQATVTFTYDLANRITQISTPVQSGNPASGAFAFSYDSAGRLYEETTPDSKVTQYQLDGNGNITKITYPDGYYVVRSFDQLDRMNNIYLNGSGTPAVQLAYDQLSRRTSLSYANGSVVAYGYQLNDDLISLNQQFNSSHSVSFMFGFNNAHQETSRSVSMGSYVWHPSIAGTVTYGTANSVNEYPTVGGASYSYTSNGCLASDGTWTFGYDSENQLTSASKTGVSASYTYDGTHRQILKTVGSTVTEFVYSGFRRIADYDATSGTLQNRYIYGPGPDEPLIVVNSSGTVTYLHSDRQHSIIAETDFSGNILASYNYSPFGESLSVPSIGFGYTGQRFDSETGLYYCKRRHLSVSTGRFLQPDPIGEAGDFQYVHCDPLNLSDPSGLDSVQLIFEPLLWQDGPLKGQPTGFYHIGMLLERDTQAGPNSPSGGKIWYRIDGIPGAPFGAFPGGTLGVTEEAALDPSLLLNSGDTLSDPILPPAGFVFTIQQIVTRILWMEGNLWWNLWLHPLPYGSIPRLYGGYTSDQVVGSLFAYNFGGVWPPIYFKYAPSFRDLIPEWYFFPEDTVVLPPPPPVFIGPQPNK